MMMPDRVNTVFVCLETTHDLGTDRRVLLDFLPFLGA